MGIHDRDWYWEAVRERDRELARKPRRFRFAASGDPWWMTVLWWVVIALVVAVVLRRFI